MNPIVVNKTTRIPYESLGGNRFRNLHNKVERDVPDEKCKSNHQYDEYY